MTSATGGVIKLYDITSVEEVDTRVGRFTSDRVGFVGSSEPWQCSDTSHVKLCARHDTRDEFASALPTAAERRGVCTSGGPYSSQRPLHLRVDGEGVTDLIIADEDALREGWYRVQGDWTRAHHRFSRRTGQT